MLPWQSNRFVNGRLQDTGLLGLSLWGSKITSRYLLGQPVGIKLKVAGSYVMGIVVLGLASALGG